MCEGCSAELQMKQMILEDGVKEDRIHYCKVLFGNEDQETLKMLLRGEEVDVISLDAVYNCKLTDGENVEECDGMVLERYLGDEGNILIFQIENGFYKNSLN